MSRCKTDRMTNPSHYQSDFGLECWDAMEIIFGKKKLRWFCRMNIFKYIWRLGMKDPVDVELKKVANYQRKAEALRLGDNRHRTDLYYLSQVRKQLLAMADKLEREIIRISAMEEKRE